MAASARSTNYLSDKQGFFSALAPKRQKPQDPFVQAKAIAKTQGYSYISQNLSSIEQDFNDLFDALQKDGNNRDKFWYYCYYCSYMLELYYQAYGKQEVADKYKKIGAQISKRYDAERLPVKKVATESYLAWLKKQLAKDLAELAEIPRHTTSIKNWAMLSNLTRMQVIFPKFLFLQNLTILSQSQFVSNLLGRSLNVDGMLKRLNQPNGFSNALSVGVFVIRLAMHSGLILKHTFVPTEFESNLSISDRFAKELKSRHCDILNDVVWGTINGITNYAYVFGIPGPVANWTLVSFLVFDLSLLIYKRGLAEKILDPNPIKPNQRLPRYMLFNSRSSLFCIYFLHIDCLSCKI